MDYTPINARRVLFAIGLTLIIGLTPAAFCVLEVGTENPSAFIGINAADGYRGVTLIFGSVLLASLTTALGLAVVRLGQRVVRRPLRA